MALIGRAHIIDGGRPLRHDVVPTDGLDLESPEGVAVMSWLGRLRRPLTRSAPAGSGRRPATPDQDSAIERIRRIPPDDNPFGVELWECADFTQSSIAMTADPDIAMRFTRLRTSSGGEHRTRLPAGASIIDCALVYPPRHLVEGPLVKAETMEDKWDIYFFPSHLYFVRSWTGAFEYRADLHTGKDGFRISRIAAAEGRDPEFSRRVVDYLIKSHLFGVLVPHPLPLEVPDDPLQVATWSFAVFGRRCALATRADTTALPWTAGDKDEMA
jgi:hypothetical protein